MVTDEELRRMPRHSLAELAEMLGVNPREYGDLLKLAQGADDDPARRFGEQVARRELER